MRTFNIAEVIHGNQHIGVYGSDDYKISDFLKYTKQQISMQMLAETNKCLFIGAYDAHFDFESTVTDNIFTASFAINYPYAVVNQSLMNIIIDSRLVGKEHEKLKNIDTWQVMLLGFNIHMLDKSRYIVMDQFRSIDNENLRDFCFDKLIDSIKRTYGCLVGSRDRELLNIVCTKVYSLD